MDKNLPSTEEMASEIQNLRERLWEAEQAIQAIRSGEVDALVITDAAGEQLYTLQGADYGYRVLVESISEGALILSQDNSIYYSNSSFAQMLQVNNESVVGSTLESYIAPDKTSEIKALIRKSRDCGKAEGEFPLLRKDGSSLPVKISLNSVSLEKFTGTCAILTNLSEQKRTEERLRVAAKKLMQSNEELKNFAFIASHDLQEPLRKIQTFGSKLHKILGKKLDESEQDFLKRMLSAANRMQQLIHDLLNYSRLSSQTEDMAKVDLNDVIKRVISNLEVAIEHAGVRLEISTMPTLKAEKTQMEQLFQNLIGNSVKFCRNEEPTIRIYSLQNKNECQIFVEDNGIGFEEKFLDRIFVPFQRLHSRGEYEGTGMGLAICRKIVERHSGSITAKSTPGKGTTFIVTLPLQKIRRSGEKED